jgi:LysM repeat protein
MLQVLRQLLKRFWTWLGEESAAPETGLTVEPGPGQFVYVVQADDNLGGIARRFSTSVWVLADLNELDDPALLQVGQQLLIPRPGAPAPDLAPKPVPETPIEPEPGPFIYIVQTGDTLTAIARRFGVPTESIVETNHIQGPNQIWPGQRLLIPAPESQPEPQPLSGPASEPPLTPAPAPTYEPEPEPGPESASNQLASLPRPLSTSRSPIPWPNDAIRGVYVSYAALGQQERRRHIIDLLTKTEINALVIDVKGDYGLVSYPTSVALAHDVGAAQPSAQDFEELMDFFKANSIYTIGRIVTFRDDPFANAHLEWAVQRETGGLWHDRDELAWADPFVQAVWEYNADLAEEAARRGFDEIQFDYVRFPLQSQEGIPSFSQPLSREARVAAVNGFLSYVRERLVSLGVCITANVFGYACWRTDDMHIGQDIEHMARYLDVLCPMLYPSAFTSGIPDHQYAIAYPYQIVHESVKRIVQQVEPLGCRVRPWIQDFPDYSFDKRVYGPAEVRAQMQGSFDGGGAGYMAWDPTVHYTKEAYFQNAIDMSLSDDYN